ncbi:phage tail length tape measure family protein [Pseudomonas sp. DCB_CB]|uniref:phage tail length tape measure family protein n=1 Tax=unclassified Pseudomonas TaxID=196821 RepID=UPI00224888DF|nr:MULTISPECIES: phage tail length tape measure family protein [unclassified Pseudomonas]MCX2694328.1 phage tail length tape measure family protein [Pseudomonas sp. DCB_BZ]MCX2859459.1 phage tail length tape measure family protein [Pseudomonas sp. DCB_CB]
MAQESRLAITIDSRSAKRNADDLTASLEKMERAGDGATSTTEGLSSSLDEQRKELSQLLGQINPTVAALGRLDDMQDKLAKFKKSGVVESDTFVEYTNRINTMREALGDTSDGMNRAGMSAKAYQAALRGLPAQFTDIAVSLQAGQAPLTVFLQQGGQLKDMFGGVGPAAKAMGGYILDLINPLTVAAAAAATLGVVFYDVEKQISAFNASLFQGGANSGQTVESLAEIAKSAASLTGSLSSAKDAVTALAAAGSTSEIQFRNLAQAAAAVSKFTGQSAADVGKAFGDLGDNATKAAQKISSEYGLLTAAQYEVIRGLDEQGKRQQALDTLSESLNKNAQERLRRYRESLSEIERDWQDIGTAISNAYSQVKGELFPDDAKQMEIAQRILDTRKEGGFVGALSNLFSFGDNTNQALREQIKLITERRGAAAAAAKAEAEITTREQRRIETSKQLADLAKSARTQTQKLLDDLKDLDKTKAESIKNGGFGAKEEADYAKARKNIEQEIADIKTREAKKNAPKNVNRGVAEAENTFARLYGQYDPAAQAARALTKEQSQLDLALTKGKITQEEYSKALAQASINYAAALKGAQGLTAVEQYRAQLQRQLVNEQAQYKLDAASVGMGDLQTSRMQQRLNLEMQTNDRLLQLQTELANATDEKQRQALQGQIDAINEFLPQQLAAMQAGWAQMDQAMLNPINGWTAAVQNFGDQARDIAGQTQSIFSSAFNSISYDITDAIMSGQLSFSTLGDIASNVVREIITGFVRMGVQMAMNAALNATLGTAAASQSMILAGTTATAWAPAAAMASLATLGANSVPAATALTSTTALATSLAVIPGFATGGYVSGAGTGTSDSIMARLSDGEFVVNAAATKRNRALLEAINSNERVSVAGGSSTAVSTQSSSSQAVVAAAPQPKVTVNLIEDRSRAGTVDQRTGDNGQLEIDAFVADIWGGGERAQAIESAYGLSRNPT